MMGHSDRPRLPRDWRGARCMLDRTGSAADGADGAAALLALVEAWRDSARCEAKIPPYPLPFRLWARRLRDSTPARPARRVSASRAPGSPGSPGRQMQWKRQTVGESDLAM